MPKSSNASIITENMNCLDKIGKELLSNLIIIERVGWPPDCIGFLYQPERPVDSFLPEDNKALENKLFKSQFKNGK